MSKRRLLSNFTIDWDLVRQRLEAAAAKENEEEEQRRKQRQHEEPKPTFVSLTELMFRHPYPAKNFRLIEQYPGKLAVDIGEKMWTLLDERVHEQLIYEFGSLEKLNSQPMELQYLGKKIRYATYVMQVRVVIAKHVENQEFKVEKTEEAVESEKKDVEKPEKAVESEIEEAKDALEEENPVLEADKPIQTS